MKDNRDLLTKKQPKLRFEGFEDIYKNLIFSDICRVKRGSSPRPINNKEYFSNISNIGWLRIQDVESKYLYKTSQFLSLKGSLKTTLIDENNLIMSICGTIGKSFINKIKIGLPDSFVCFMNLKSDINYFYYLTQKINWTKLIQTGSQGNLNSSLISNKEIWIPTVDEQQKIAKFLSLLDKQIELYVSKLALTEKIKLFYLNNLFTSNELPKLRFRGFNDDFIKESLKDIYGLKKGEQLPSTYKNIDGKYYHLNGGRNYSCKCNHFNTNENSISISEGGESCGYVSWNKEKFWAGGHLYVLHLLKNYNNKYFYFLLKNYEKNIMKFRVGSSIPNIQKNDLENLKILYSTNINEQQKIAKLLGLYDYYIEFLVKKINSTKELKKYYLKNLFI